MKRMFFALAGCVLAVVIPACGGGGSDNAVCGDNVCDSSESATSCAADCGCGNGFVNPGEDCDGTDSRRRDLRVGGATRRNARLQRRLHVRRGWLRPVHVRRRRQGSRRGVRRLGPRRRDLRVGRVLGRRRRVRLQLHARRQRVLQRLLRRREHQRVRRGHGAQLRAGADRLPRPRAHRLHRRQQRLRRERRHRDVPVRRPLLGSRARAL